jgi:hypothetical protein
MSAPITANMLAVSDRPLKRKARFYPSCMSAKVMIQVCVCSAPSCFSFINPIAFLFCFFMTQFHSDDLAQLRAEIAAAAARMIAEDGASYGMAKRKAAEQILGGTKVRGDFMPDNAQIEDEVRIYQHLFLSDTQPARLLHLRKLALRLMSELTDFRPYLIGAVLNGTAGDHSDIHLHLFVDSPKDVEIFLLNKNIRFEVSESPHFFKEGEPVETISFMWQGEGAHLALYQTNDLRRAGRTTANRLERADIEAVRKLLDEGIINE